MINLQCLLVSLRESVPFPMISGPRQPARIIVGIYSYLEMLVLFNARFETFPFVAARWSPFMLRDTAHIAYARLPETHRARGGQQRREKAKAVL
jgi:hypothetical protein